MVRYFMTIPEAAQLVLPIHTRLAPRVFEMAADSAIRGIVANDWPVGWGGTKTKAAAHARCPNTVSGASSIIRATRPRYAAGSLRIVLVSNAGSLSSALPSSHR